MLKKIFISTIIFAAFTAVDGRANIGASIHVDPDAYGTETFKCRGRTFFSDIILPNVHGCDLERTEQGAHGLPSNLITVHYDWEDSENGAKKPRKVTFYETPDGDLYRLLDTTFLESKLLDEHFLAMVTPLPEAMGELTNISLERFGRRNIDVFNNNFCMNYHLKYPFQGIFGWCQGDRLVGGDVDYLGGAMSFGEAAIRVQNFVYDQGLQLSEKILSAQTITAFNTDKKNWVYYGFAVPGRREGGGETIYIFRVYFNGYIEVREVAEMPEDPYDL